MTTSLSPKERLLECTRLFLAGKHQEALAAVDALLAENPSEGPMLWQRARILDKLERYEEARAAVKRVLEVRRDFAPALVLRAELGDEDESYDPEPDLRRAIALDPKLGRARYLLALVLNGRDEKLEESQVQLDTAIELDPQLHEALATRAGWSRIGALTEQTQDAPDGPDVVTTFTGLKFSRAQLEAALADFERAIAIQAVPNYRFARADLLHLLGRYDEALAEVDRLLAEIPEDHSLRDLAVEARKKSENQGRGEREQLASLFVKALDVPAVAKDKETLAYDQASAMIRSMADGVRAGKSVPQVMQDFGGGSPEDEAAVSIAWQIKQMSEEAPPDYRPTNAREYPSHQRAFEAAATKQLVKLGFEKLGDYDPAHLAVTLARKQMLTLYVRADGHTTAAVFSIKPKWPGFVGWLLTVVKGVYKTARVIELETAFSDGTVLSTNNMGGLNPTGRGRISCRRRCRSRRTPRSCSRCTSSACASTFPRTRATFAAPSARSRR
jgi:tetratricopeptide (TPR) repeat protein